MVAAAAEEDWIRMLRQPENPMAVSPPAKKAKLDAQPAAPLSSRPSQSRLHNFSFSTLSWGTQRLLRCSKSPDGIDLEAARSPPIGSAKKRSSSSSSEEAAAAASAVAERPWNLRSKRSACVAPPSPVKIGGSRKAPPPTSASCLLSDVAPAVEERDAAGLEGAEKKERPRFSISLAREEVEADFLALASKKPPRRPKKRPKMVQRQLDVLFPGFGLTEITPDMYKIDE